MTLLAAIFGFVASVVKLVLTALRLRRPKDELEKQKDENKKAITGGGDAELNDLVERRCDRVQKRKRRLF